MMVKKNQNKVSLMAEMWSRTAVIVTMEIGLVFTMHAPSLLRALPKDKVSDTVSNQELSSAIL